MQQIKLPKDIVKENILARNKIDKDKCRLLEILGVLQAKERELQHKIDKLENRNEELLWKINDISRNMVLECTEELTREGEL